MASAGDGEMMAKRIVDKETGIEYKKCGACKQYKPLTEFYPHRGRSKDNLTYRCKICQQEYSKNHPKKDQSPPQSTQDGIEILRKNQIPAHPGSGLGMPWVDLVAWGCVPIEVKGSKVDQNRVLFGFTPRQRELLLDEISGGFLMLIANSKSRKRVFVIPADDKWLIRKFKQNVSGLAFALDSDRANAHSWKYVRKFENCFHLIEQARIKISYEMGQEDD